MLKIVLYGAMVGKYGSRQMVGSRRREWLLNGEKAPSYRSSCRFRSKVFFCRAKEVFYALVKKLEELGKIQFEHLFAEGTKLEANVNK